MKKLIFTATLMVLVFVSCNNKNKESETLNSEMKNQDSTMVDQKFQTENHESQMYACPMHPEVQGKKGDTCSKCGMELTKPVVKNETPTENHEGHENHEH
ncbi:heavy metal-binding domain-containing protein [Flavobacterium sp. H122]|uniref:heavy metal-binding domain-containing protein n=1 Tax=Flavobacterium sp. H122 TaxID=2529860 RepID=UPI001B7D8D3C|nr:heavy metal-binding domain-containing protein [Flavobacterium sp. H122]